MKFKNTITHTLPVLTVLDNEPILQVQQELREFIECIPDEYKSSTYLIDAEEYNGSVALYFAYQRVMTPTERLEREKKILECEKNVENIEKEQLKSLIEKYGISGE